LSGSDLEQAAKPSRYAIATRARIARYAFAVVLSLGGILLTAALTPDRAELYALLVGVVAITVWYGGLGPGLVAVAAGWTFELIRLAFVDDEFQGISATRWAVTLGIALSVVWVSVAMRWRGDRAARAVDDAEATFRDLAGLHELSTVLLAAVTPSDVARGLIERTPSLVGARGGSLGLIDGTELVIVDPQVTGSTHEPGFRLPLETRAPIAEAARLGSIVRVNDRQTFERDFPDGAALTLYANGAVAAPLWVAGEVAGALSLLFADTETAHEEADAIVGLVADLGGQALERARLYAKEREAHEALDRILRVAPRFHTDSVESAAAAICSEAAATFGSDVAMLWRLTGHRLELVHAAPADTLPAGLEGDLKDFPSLLDALDRLHVSFVPDIQQEARGEGLERVRRLGLHSSLRVPVAIGGGKAELVLIVSWTRIISEPDPSTVVLLRRFADQAGFALEQVERRLAQAEAASRAEEARRLQEVTADLSLASTTTEVSDTCLAHALEAVGAEAGFIVLSQPDAVVVDLVSSSGYSDDELDWWGRFELDADVPFARAIASGEPVWALTQGDMAGFLGIGEVLPDRGWVALPLRTSAGVRGALHLSLRHERELSDRERQWLVTFVSQCAQALERSRLFDMEQVLRQRSDRLQRLTAALSNSVTRTDVAKVVVDETRAALDASATALGIVLEERQIVKLLAWVGYSDESVEPRLEVSLDESTPGNRAVKRRVSAFYPTLDDVREALPDVSEVMELAEHQSFLYVPLVAGRRANGLLILSWAEPYRLSTEDRRFVENLAGQAAQALDRASLFESEQTIAETLQRSVLPASLPRVEGVQLAARYLPGSAGVNVGGDWFDAIRLADGQLGLVVGDVVGKGVQAAATMAQLRNALRAFALDRMKPSSTVTRLNRLAEEMDTAFATVAYAVVDPDAGVCRYTSAGHPPPLAAFPDGRVELLEGARSLPLGAGPDTKYTQEVLELPVGTVLVLYTDGLVERRGQTIDEGFERLRLAVLEGPREPQKLVEHLLERLAGDAERGDDIALLAIRLLAVAPRPLYLRVPSDTRSLDLVRDSLRSWLAGTELGRSDVQDVVLAVWEVCANSIEHAADASDDLVVRAELSDSRVRVSIVHTGEWNPPTESFAGASGLRHRLMHATMSSVDITSSPEGTRVTLEKSFR
jgi:serine phosphatase RsbU (regulator of sigma subunit)/anti-sigma regulatory factor (Ser/Thr protein kinase)